MRGLGCAVGFEFCEEVFGHGEYGLVGAEEFEDAILCIEQSAAFRGEADLVGLEGEEVGGDEVIDEGLEDVVGHVGAGGEHEGIEAFAGIGFLFEDGVEDAGVAEGPPGDEGDVSGDETVSGLVGGLAGDGKHALLR
jgi:hypothetical protein